MATIDSEKIALLSFRNKDEGGEAVTPSQDCIEEIGALLCSGPARGLVLLIHGYNNNKFTAEEAYAGFFNMQKSINQLKEHRRLAGNRVFAQVYWPGDADWGLFSFAFYMGSIENAKKTAMFLADSLEKIAKYAAPLEIDIVGHSMGCRLAIELLGKLAPETKVRVGRIVLMAAAVPTFMLERGGALRSAYDSRLSVVPGRVKSLHSMHDNVLALAFPAGQTLAPGAEGTFPTALGREEWISSFIPGNLEQCEIAKAGHSDYWGWKESTRDVARKANTEVRDFLGFDHASDRTQEERESAEAIGTTSRCLLPPRELLEYEGATCKSISCLSL